MPIDQLTSENVKRFYFRHFSELDSEQQMHFAWTLYAWNGSHPAYQRLVQLKPITNLRSLWERLEARSASNSYGKGKMIAIQRKYFSRHPGLLAKTWQLLYLLRLQTIYGIDARDSLLRHSPLSHFKDTLSKLEADPEAIAMLTGAINYIYLVNHLLFNQPKSIDPYQLTQNSKPHYNPNDPIHIKILSYLYTHLVMNESYFFTKPIPEQRHQTYQELMRQAEAVIRVHYQELSLDNKCEFLACARFCGISSDLEAVITNEAIHSSSHKEPYVTDALNHNPNKHEPNIANMAHTMTYFILYSGEDNPRNGISPFQTNTI